MSTTIIHVTDPHFGNESPTYNREKIKTAFIDKINNEPGDKVLIISGDITYKGRPQGYDEASEFFSSVIIECGISRSNVIACPGNHDILPDITFNKFDKFIYSLRRDDIFSASQKNESTIEIGDTIFVTSNSSYHLDHKYGLIPDSTIEKLFAQRERILQFDHKIFITHHHLINQRDGDLSTIRNTHKLLHTLDQLQFDYVLHGHQHSSSDLSFGERGTKILSGRSLNFHDKGYHNGFSTIAKETGTIKRFIATPDEDPTKLIFREL
ncbi:metallophosphoesterase [Pseudomonas sp. Sample_10]|uniref:metallophosphoesterase family protein n=1 Tax=Pseudomonas sp. Sample_10 TaxID=2448269 RepID=UPI001035BB0E|nr:metallophosphoesterase [Pseudomonas sp. Sample_10]